ncbi:MAG: hypothetical protein M1132_00860 [Chloroflexi bacterium]|nr:hypothetical protein [Chloroflexota bacterium]
MTHPLEAASAEMTPAALTAEFKTWLQAGGYHPATCQTYERMARVILDEMAPWTCLATLSSRLGQRSEPEKKAIFREKMDHRPTGAGETRRVSALSSRTGEA